MNSSPRIGLIGIGGYGQRHLLSLSTLAGSGLCQLGAICDPFAGRFHEQVAALQAQGIAIEEEWGKFVERDDFDAVVIATPIALHAPQTLRALESGKHVYIEKPPCVTLDEYCTLRAAQDAADKVCSVGFQLQTTPAIAYLKQQLVQGAIGDLQTVWSSVRWQRGNGYYNRSPWAAKWTLDGAPVFDGPATNALSHVVHAALFLAGPTESVWGEVARVRGALKKARPIESYDSAFLEVETANSVSVRLAFTHATEQQDEVVISCVGSAGKASLRWNGTVTIETGETSHHLNFPCDPALAAMIKFLHALKQPATQDVMALANSLSYLQTVNGALQSSRGAKYFAAEKIAEPDSTRNFYTVAGLDEEFAAFGEDGDTLPASLDASGNPWLSSAQISHSLFQTSS